MDREQAVEFVATTLLPQTSLLTRLVAKQANWTVARSEGSVLSTVARAPRRITELADLEGLAQPTVTTLVKKLEERGWVERAGHADDGRVVLVSITSSGTHALEAFREQYRALLRELMSGMDDREIAELHDATAAIAKLVEALQS